MFACVDYLLLLANRVHRLGWPNTGQSSLSVLKSRRLLLAVRLGNCGMASMARSKLIASLLPIPSHLGLGIFRTSSTTWLKMRISRPVASISSVREIGTDGSKCGTYWQKFSTAMQFGTEPFTGGEATMTVSNWSASVEWFQYGWLYKAEWSRGMILMTRPQICHTYMDEKVGPVRNVVPRLRKHCDNLPNGDCAAVGVMVLDKFVAVAVNWTDLKETNVTSVAAFCRSRI